MLRFSEKYAILKSMYTRWGRCIMAKNTKSRFETLTQDPIPGLVIKLAIPTMVAMIITSVYNMADTYFVSQISQSASAAVGIVSSLMSIIQTLGFTIAFGCSLAISNELGRKNDDYAIEILSSGFFFAIVFAIVFAIAGLIFLEPLMLFLGSTETILPHAVAYASSIFLACPFMMASYVLTTCLRSQGNAFQSMIGLGGGALINIVLDPIFIFKLGLGVGGAGYATAISQIISFFLLFYLTNFRPESISVNIKKVSLKIDVYKDIIVSGMPNLFRQGLGSSATIILNVLANPYGDAAIAAISIVTRLVTFVASLFHGFGQGFQPISGYNFTAKKYDRVLESFWFTFKVGIIAMFVIGAFGFVFAENLISIFREGDSEVIAIGTFMLKVNCVVFPLQCFSNVSAMLAQSIGYSYRATLLSMARQGIFFIPIVFIFANVYGLLGLQIAQPVAEVLAVAFSLYILKSVINDLTNLKNLYN